MRHLLRLAIACCGGVALSGCIGLSIGGRTIQQTCPDLDARMSRLESRVNGLEQAANPPAVMMLPAEPNYELPTPVQTPPQAFP